MTLSPKMKALNLLPRVVRRELVKRRFTREVNEFGEAELPMLRNYVGKGDLALDVGCNVGAYAFELSRLTGNVVAFEPNPALADMVRGYGLRGVKVESVALTSSEGTAQLSFPAHHGGHALGSLKSDLFEGQATETVSVRTRTLDSYGFRDVRFIKIDVEGFEEEVLAGAMTTVRESRPILLIEIEERHNAGGIGRITSTLRDLGYRGVYFLDGQQHTAESLDHQANAQALSGVGSSTSRRAAKYVNNFFFLPDGNR